MSDDVSSNVGNVCECGIEMNVEQNGRDAVWRLSQHLSGRPEEQD